MTSIRLWAQKILASSSLETKLRLCKEAFLEIQNSQVAIGSPLEVKWQLPENLEVLPPKQLPSLKHVNPEVLTLHNIAHIEFMAIHMYWDTMARAEAPYSFFRDFAFIAQEETTHLGWLIHRLQCLGSDYPSFPSHNMLMRHSEETKHSITERLVMLSLFSEARALDSKDRLAHKLSQWNKDCLSSELVKKIIEDEVNHVRLGVRWFKHFCEGEPREEFRRIITQRAGVLRPPFNLDLRDLAEFPRDWYEGLC